MLRMVTWRVIFAVLSVDILPEEDGEGFYVVVPALPGCFSQGKTVEVSA